MHNTEMKIDGAGKIFNDIVAKQIEITNTNVMPDSIFHFTDHNGLAGIIKNKKLWLSDIFQMNDPSELSFGMSIADDALKLLPSRSSARHKQFIEALKAIISFADYKNVAHILALCFSKDPEDLDQWRSYGDNGAGFALEFDGQALEEAFIAHKIANASCHTFHVRYDVEQLEQTVKNLISEADRLAQERDFKISEIAQSLLNNLVLISLMFKHSAYRREGEVRFMQTFSYLASVSNFLYRTKPYRLIKYVEFDWSDASLHALKSIRVGPSAPAEAIQYARDLVRVYLGEEHLCRVIPTNIPYRR